MKIWIRLYLFIFIGTIISEAQDNLYLNTGNDNSNDIIFHNPAGIGLNNNIYLSLSTQLLWTSLDGDNLRQDYLSYAHPITHGFSLGIRGNYFSSNIFSQGAISLLVSKKLYKEKLSIGLNVNYLFYNYNRDEFNLVDMGDPVLEKGSSANAISFGLGFFYKPNPFVNLGISLDHINQPDITIEKSGVKKDMKVKIGSVINLEPVKPQFDIKIEESDVLIQGGLWKGFFKDNLNFFLGYDFVGSDKNDLLIETNFFSGSFGFAYNFQYPLNGLSSITSGCHRFNCVFNIPLPEKTEKKKPIIPIVEKPVIRGQKWAVIIGVSKYKDSRIRQLKYAADDAKAFYDWLTSDAGGNYRKDHIKLILDEEATYTNINRTLREWLKNPIKEDMVTIYFAGHGAPENPNESKNYYLLTYDTDLDYIASTAFPMWHVEDALTRHIKAGKVVIVADVCHAGGISDGFYNNTRSLKINVHQINRRFEEFSKLDIGKALCILNASSKDQLSQEGKQWGGGHGVFTYYLLEGLKGRADRNKDKKVSLGEISNYVSETVRRATKNAQTPTVAGDYDPQIIIQNEK